MPILFTTSTSSGNNILMTKATVAAVVTPDSDKRDIIVLTKRSVSPFKGCWCLPGGHIDYGETALAAIIREVAEETGLELSDPRFFCYSDELFPEFSFHAVALVFIGRGEGSLQLMADEVAEISWFPLHEAIKLPLAFNHLQILQRYAQHLS
jgi:8-oxo-dGTP diphosphatase